MNQNKSIRIMCTQSGRSQIQNGRCGQGNCRNERANRAVVAHPEAFLSFCLTLAEIKDVCYQGRKELPCQAAKASLC